MEYRRLSHFDLVQDYHQNFVYYLVMLYFVAINQKNMFIVAWVGWGRDLLNSWLGTARGLAAWGFKGWGLSHTDFG